MKCGLYGVPFMRYRMVRLGCAASFYAMETLPLSGEGQGKDVLIHKRYRGVYEPYGKLYHIGNRYHEG